jgi:hypothetical protein
MSRLFGVASSNVNVGAAITSRIGLAATTA